MMKKTAILLCSTLLFSLGAGQTASASKGTTVIEDDTITWEVKTGTSKLPDTDITDLVGIGTKSPYSQVQLYSTLRPSKVWNVKKKKYKFKGITSSPTLYTNYKLTGKNTYSIYVKNLSKNKIKFKAKRMLKTYVTQSVPAKQVAKITFTGIKSDTEFYLTFDGRDIEFKGHIK